MGKTGAYSFSQDLISLIHFVSISSNLILKSRYPFVSRPPENKKGVTFSMGDSKDESLFGLLNAAGLEEIYWKFQVDHGAGWGYIAKISG